MQMHSIALSLFICFSHGQLLQEQINADPVLSLQTGYHRDIGEDAILTLQESDDQSLLQTRLLASPRANRTNVSSFQAVLESQSTATGSYVFAGSTRFTELLRSVKYESWLWSPLFLLAAVKSFASYKGEKQEQSSTSAITGFRAATALWIVLEHAGFHCIPGAGTFIILSGVVLATSRRASPGVVPKPINSFSKYCEFAFLRLARLFPLYWFYLGCIEPKIQEEQYVGIIDFLRKMPSDFSTAWRQNAPDMLAIRPRDDHLWFISTIIAIYLFYPFLERVALGPEDGQPHSRSRLQFIFGICCLAKLLTVIFMWSIHEQMSSTWYIWRGWKLYCNPILRLPEFLMGMLVPHLATHHATRWNEWAPLCADILLVSMLVLLFIPKTEAFLLLVNMNVQAPIVALAMWGFCFGPQRSPLGRFFSSPYLVKVGEWGYGIYVFHYQLVKGWEWKIGSLTSSPWISIPGLVLIVAQAWCMFTLMETPCAKLARWLLVRTKA